MNITGQTLDTRDIDTCHTHVATARTTVKVTPSKSSFHKEVHSTHSFGCLKNEIEENIKISFLKNNFNDILDISFMSYVSNCV